MKRVTSRYRVNGPALRAFRYVSGKTQVALAVEAGANHSYISRLERGERLGCTHEVLEKLAIALGVPMPALVAADLEE